jgi:hypothetical protein
VVVPASGLVIASTAVSSTAAELNLLDGLDRGSILYGNASSATTVLGQGSADQVLTSDGTDISWEDASGGGISGLTGLVENDSIWLGNDPSGTTSTASYSVALGTTALDAITTGDSNSAIGYGALTANTTGANNVAIGKSALVANTTGAQNVAIGNTALDAATTVNNNVAIGFECLTASTIGDNVAVGTSAMSANTTGAYNVAVGKSAMAADTIGASNVAIGAFALDANTTGGSNVAVGSDALGACTTGGDNTAVGKVAGSVLTTASNTLLIGHDAGLSGSPGGSIITDSNYLVLGDSNITHANIKVDWSVSSDARDKTDVTPMDLGLEFVNQLEPVTYRWDERIKYSDDQSVTPDGTHKEEQLEGGFLAQAVETLEGQYGYQLSNQTNLTFHKSTDEKMYGIKYGKFVPILVKAIQELSAEVEELKKKAHNKCDKE